MATINEANESLVNLMFTGIDHGIESIKDSKGPLIPFLLIENRGQRNLQRFVSETLEESLASARQYLAELADTPEFAVIVYDGYLTVEEKKYDAVMVEGFDQNDAKVYAIAQRYQPKKLLSKFKEVGNVAFLGSFDKA